MLREVNVSVTDNLLGAGNILGDGTHIKIGASNVLAEEPIIIRGSYNADKIKKLLGYSPLADSVMDSIENGSSLILCIPGTASTLGTVSEVKKIGTSTGTITVEGTPTNAFDCKVKITGSGALNVGSYCYSINGGYSYSDEATIPADGNVEITNCGIKIKFDAADSKTYALGDVFSFSTTAPTMSNADVLKAVDKLKNMNTEFEYVHIVGESSSDLWASISTAQQKLLKENHKPMFFLLEASKPLENETIDIYASRLIAEAKNIKNYDIQVCSARGNYLKMDGKSCEQNLASVITGLYSKAKVSQSIGEVKAFPIKKDKLNSLTPLNIDEQIEALDEANFLTLRNYDGMAGYFVTAARMMCAEYSDYQYAEDIRVKNKIIREIRMSALLELQGQVDMESESSIRTSLGAKVEFIKVPLDTMKREKEISDYTVEMVDPIENMKNGLLSLIVRYKAKGIVREIVIDLGRAG